ncbi:MAG: response regulator [Rhodospirillaceae bacterium]
MTSRIPTGVMSIGLGVLAGISYALLGKFGSLFAIPGTALCVFWPPDAFTLAILVLSHPRHWPFIAIGSWLGDFPNEFVMTSSYRDSVILATTDSAVALLPAAIIRRYAGEISAENCIRWFTILAISYCLFSAPLAGLFSALTVYGHDFTFAEVSGNTISWVLSIVPSALIIVPLAIALRDAVIKFNQSYYQNWRSRKRVVLFLALIMVIAACNYYEFFIYFPDIKRELNLFLPALIILSYYYGMIGAGLGCTLVLLSSGLAPLLIVADADALAKVVFDLQVAELGNIVAVMVFACVGTRMRFNNLKLEDVALRAERSEAEAWIRANEIETLFMHAPVAISQFDRDYRYIRVNTRLAQNNGMSVAEHIGRRQEDILPAPLAHRLKEIIAPIFETGIPVLDLELHGETASAPGIPRHWLASFIPVKSATGEVTSLMAVVLDITERKRLEAAQRESERRARFEEQRFRDFAESSAEFFFEFDKNERFTFCSSSSYINTELLIGRTVKDVFAPTPEEYQLNLAAWEERGRAIEERRPWRKIEFNLAGADGQREIAAVSGTPMYDTDGRFIGYRGTSTTVTGKYREIAMAAAKAAAENANMAKSEFLSNMSHEIRTPMNAILGLTHLLTRTPLTPEQADCVNKVSISGKALMGILNDILDFSKIDAGRMDLETIDFRLDDVISTLATIMSVTVASKDLETIIGIDNPVPNWLRGDPTRLQQILVNLVGNAIKFTETGEVAVHAELTEQSSDCVMVRFSVRDTGIGLSEEQQARLFQPFTQADMTTTRRFGGTGLGLVICKRLVELMGGTIGVISAPGKGSEFWFTLPFQIGRPIEDDLEREHILTDLEVLVVDDNATARMYISATAESIGMHPDSVDSGEHALDRLHEKVEQGTAYDLLLIDWQMPGMNGLETSKKIREDAMLAGTRPPIVIMVTAFTREEVFQSPEANFVDGVLVKPVTASALLNIVAEVQARRHGGLGPLLDEVRRGKGIAMARLEGLRILVVEDNTLNQDVARAILEEEGATVEIADDGTEAVKRLRPEHSPDFDLVLMDAQMPVMDGFTATALIREELQLKDLPIIALTAGVRVEDQEKCLGCGMNGFVAKPFDVPQLVNTILHHVGRLTDAKSNRSATQILNSKVDAALQSCSFDIPGLDLRQALLRVGGKTDLLRSMLKRMVVDFEGVGERTRADLRNGRLDQAARVMHTLRGAAGNLAAVELSKQASRIETAVRAGEPLAATIPMVNELDATFAKFSQAVLTMAEDDEAQAGSGDITPAKLDLLIGLLENGDLNALNEYRSLRPMILSRLSLGDRKSLDRMLEELDLEAAAQILKSLSVGAA